MQSNTPPNKGSFDKKSITPHKIYLLKLIQLHTEQQIDRGISQYVCSFLVEQLTDTKYVTEPTLDEFVLTFEAALPHSSHAQPILQKLHEPLLQITSPDMAVAVLLKMLSPLFGDGEDLASVSGLELEIARMALDTIFGDFVATMATCLRYASFTTLMRLCKRIEAYKRSGSTSRSIQSKQLDSSTGDLRSVSENMQYLQREAETIESLVGVLPRHEITTRIDRLSIRLPRTPQVAFLSYLVCLHHGDYMGALDKSHQYFDQVMIQNTMSSVSLLPYATLNLAAVHLRFGHIDEALELVREVTANVQRRKDNICLARTLSLLFRLSEHRCDQSYQLQLLQQTLSRALSLSMGSLSTQTMLDTAKHYLLHPRESVGVSSIPLPQIGGSGDFGVNPLDDAMHGGNGRPQAHPEAVWRLIHASLSAATCTSESPTESAMLTSKALVASANVWSIYGNTTMASLASHLQLDIHRTHNLNSGLDGTKSSNLLVSTKLPTTDACTSLCALARTASENGKTSRAIALLVEAFQEYPQSTSQPQWIRSTRQILQEQALCRGDLETAETQAVQLSALSPLNLDLHQHIDSLYRLAVVLMYKNDWTKAITLVQSLIETCEGCGLTLQAIPFRLTLAEILLRSHNPLAAMAPLLECLMLAREFRLDAIVATASVQLAHIHLLDSTSTHDSAWSQPSSAQSGNDSVRRAKKALELLDRVMPHILQHGPRLLQAQAQLEFVKAELLLSSTTVIHPETKEKSKSSTSGAQSNDEKTPTWQRNASYEVCTASLDQIEDVIEIATALQSTQLLLEAYYFKARLAHALGLNVQRNIAAKRFKELQLAPMGTMPNDAMQTERSSLQSVSSGTMHYYLDISDLVSRSLV